MGTSAEGQIRYCREQIVVDDEILLQSHILKSFLTSFC